MPVLILLAGVTSCIDIPQEQHTSYETMTLVRQDIVYPVSWSATIVGKNDVSIIPQTSGQLVKVCVTEGQKVRKGQQLFIIDQRQANIALMTANANLQASEAQMNTARLEYDSNKNLYDKGIVSEYLLNTSLNDYNRAKATVAQAQAAVAQAKLNLEYCTITSPVDGMVGSIPNNPGDQVSTMTLLTTISGNTEMIAKFSLTETQVQESINEVGNLNDAIAQLPPLTLTTKDGMEYKYKGRVESISGVLDQSTGSVTCRGTFPNPDGFLYSGMQGTVQMPFDYSGIIVIPLTAVVRVQDKTMVYRVNNENCAESVMVSIEELSNGKDAAILDGIDVGTVIVAKGVGNIFEGQQVIFPEKENKKK